MFTCSATGHVVRKIFSSSFQNTLRPSLAQSLPPSLPSLLLLSSRSIFFSLLFLPASHPLSLSVLFSLSLPVLHSVRQIIPPVSTLQSCFIYSTRLSLVCIIHTVYIYAHTLKGETHILPLTVCVLETLTHSYINTHANMHAHMRRTIHTGQPPYTLDLARGSTY